MPNNYCKWQSLHTETTYSINANGPSWKPQKIDDYATSKVANCQLTGGWQSAKRYLLLSAIVTVAVTNINSLMPKRVYIIFKSSVDPLRSIDAHLGDRRYSSYSFLTSALEGGEWSASRPGRTLPPGKGSPVPTVQEAGWAPEPVWTQRLEEKSSAPVGDWTPAVQSVVRHYILPLQKNNWLITVEGNIRCLYRQSH
jgi:hypothetical protein